MIDKTQNFIQRAISIHGNKYDYSNVNYVNTHTKVDISCPKHGTFSQRPNDHLTKRAGCPPCSGKSYMTLPIFIARAKEIHGDKYDYSKTTYDGYEIPTTIICPKHGEFQQKPKAHVLQKHGCPQCGVEVAIKKNISNRLTTKQFITAAQEVHGDLYNYLNAQYVNSGTKVELICQTHGSFFQTPNNHVSRKQGCPKCADQSRLAKCVGRYSPEFFDLHPEQRNVPAILYVIEMTLDTDHFVKVGITTKSVEERFNRGQTRGVAVHKTILLTKYMSLEKAFNLEQKILSELKEYQYFPNHLIDGRTECLKNKPEVFNKIEAIILTEESSTL